MQVGLFRCYCLKKYTAAFNYFRWGDPIPRWSWMVPIFSYCSSTIVYSTPFTLKCVLAWENVLYGHSNFKGWKSELPSKIPLEALENPGKGEVLSWQAMGCGDGVGVHTSNIVPTTAGIPTESMSIEASWFWHISIHVIKKNSEVKAIFKSLN